MPSLPPSLPYRQKEPLPTRATMRIYVVAELRVCNTWHLACAEHMFIIMYYKRYTRPPFGIVVV